VTLGALLSYFALAFFNPALMLSPRHIVLFWIFLLVLICSSRLLYNFYVTYQKRELTRLAGGDRTLIYGAGDRGEVLLSSLIKEDVLDYKPIDFIDDNPAKLNKEILGYPILGDINNLERLVLVNNVQRIIISSPFVNGNREGMLKDICKRHNLKLCRFTIQFDTISLAN
jgi:FlaA1/EpsC-like NDP-sugar epimerase